jgi:four helix bundle protein
MGCKIEKQNVIVDKSFYFALSIIELYKYPVKVKKEYVLSKQLLRTGTSVGANIRDAVVTQSKKEFIAKMNISLKEIHECQYWLQLLSKSGFIINEQCLENEVNELIKIITAIIKTSNEN